jgi:hypothetical protein
LISSTSLFEFSLRSDRAFSRYSIVCSFMFKVFASSEFFVKCSILVPQSSSIVFVLLSTSFQRFSINLRSSSRVLLSFS